MFPDQKLYEEMMRRGSRGCAYWRTGTRLYSAGLVGVAAVLVVWPIVLFFRFGNTGLGYAGALIAAAALVVIGGFLRRLSYRIAMGEGIDVASFFEKEKPRKRPPGGRKGLKDGVVMIIGDGKGRFLMGRRSPHKKLAPGYWCPVSGRVEEGETQEQAVARECREEIGIEARAVRKVDELVTPDGAFLLHFWLTEVVSGEPAVANDEHTEIRWVTVPEMRRLDPVFEEDVDIMERLAAGG